MYDYIIIGAGAAGIYCAHMLKKIYNNVNILILESNHDPGGRTRQHDFDEIKVNSGAYGIHVNKDKYVLNLLREMKFKIKGNISQIDYTYLNKKIDINEVVDYCKYLINDNNKNWNTKTFITNLLSEEHYDAFVQMNGRSDFEHENIVSMIENYDIEDNLSGNKISSVDWNLLWNKLITTNNINILYNTLVKSIIQRDNNIIVVSADNKKFLCKKLILAVDIFNLQRLLPDVNDYNVIGCQPFIRVYAYMNKKGDKILSNLIKQRTLVSNSLQNIIPIINNLYMISYADGMYAQQLSKYTHNTKETYKFYEKCIREALNLPKNEMDDTIIKIKVFYNNPGTHFFKYYQDWNKFLKKNQNPFENIFVCGECLSTRQGWVEGALQSVHNIIEFL